MAGSLGDLTIDLNANIARFMEAMDAAALKSERTAAQIKKALIGVGAGLVGGATLAGIKSLIDSTIEAASALKEMGEKAGTSAEQLSSLGAVAKLSGTGVETVTEGLIKLSKGLAGSEDMTGNTGRALKALGIAAKDSAGNLRDPAEVYRDIALKLGEYRDGAGKTALAIDAFGKAGAQQLPVLKDMYELGDQVAKVTNEQARQANEYEKNLKRLEMQKAALVKTIVFSMLPAMSGFVQGLLDASKQSDNLKSSLKRVTEDTTFSDSIDAMAMGLARFIDVMKVVPNLLSAIGGSFAAVTADIKLAGTAFVLFNPFSLAQSFKDGRNPFAEFNRALDERNKTVAASNQKYVELWTTPANAVEQSVKRQIEAARQAAVWANNIDTRGMREYEQRAKKSLDYSNKDPKATAAPDPSLRAGDAFIEQLQRRLESQQHGPFDMLRLEAQQKAQLVGDAMAKAAKPASEIAAAQKHITETASGYILQLEEIELRNERIKKIIEQTAEDEKQRAKITGAVTGGNELAKSIIEQTEALGLNADEQQRLSALRQIDKLIQVQMVDANSDTIVALLKMAEVIKGNVNRALDDQIKKQNELNASWKVGAKAALYDYGKAAADTAGQVKSAILNGLRGMEDALVRFVTTGKLSFKDMVNSIVADLARILIKQNITGPLASFFGGLFADGGDPPVGVPSIVGERGPELFVPKTAGTIIPNSALAAGSGGTTIINQYFTVGDVASMAQVKAAVATSERRIFSATQRSLNYGGALA